jgi:hypothetical protein
MKDELDIAIVSTLDGGLHGIDQTTGEKLWTLHQDITIKVTNALESDRENPFLQQDSKEIELSQQGLFIPEISGSGDLYYVGYENGEIKVSSNLLIF